MGEIKIENLTFSYTVSDGLKTTLGERILDNISLKLNPGEFVSILGKSGCGKSTFLRLISGLEKPTEGRILLDGQEIVEAGLDRGVVFQDYGLFPWMTAGNNLLLALKKIHPQMSKNELKDKMYSYLRDVGLEASVANKLPKELSGGMQQRCSIAQALCLESETLLMDEPFGALDAVTRSMLQDLLLGLWNKFEGKKTIVFVTHDVDEAILLSNRIIVLGQKPAHIIFDETVDKSDVDISNRNFKDPKLIELRNKLIDTISQNIESQKI